MASVLVTGGAGFIGSELVRQLAAEGHAVRVIDNLANGKRENLMEVLSDRVQLTIVDIRDSRVASLLDGVDVVYHLACLGVRHSIHSPIENHEVNATGTLQLLCAARASGVSRFVYVSSSEVYGTALLVPMAEDHPTVPMTVYGASKLAGEAYTRAYYRVYKFPTVIVRPFNTYGPRCHHEGDSGEVIPKFLLRCLAGKPMVIFGDGTQTRDFTFVTDTARGILLAGFAEHVQGQTINLGTGREIRIKDLAEQVRAAARRPRATICYDAPRPGDVLRLCCDNSRAKQALGFEPTVTLRRGLEILMAWYEGLDRSPEALLEEEIVRNWVQPNA